MMTVNNSGYANGHRPVDMDLPAYMENSSTYSSAKHMRLHQSQKENNSNVKSVEILSDNNNSFESTYEETEAYCSAGAVIDKQDDSDDATGKFNKLGSQNRKHQCRVCNKLYELKSSLHRHMRVHQGLDEYKCEICSKQFSDTKSLTGHLFIHTGEKPYICSFCGYKFRHKSTLNVHEKRHGTEMPFKCDVCEKEFFVRVDLRKHMKIQHRDEKIRCDQCGKEFFLLTEFKRHYRSHTGRNPFECQYCGKCFTDQPSLVDHIVQHKDHDPVQDVTNNDVGDHSVNPYNRISRETHITSELVSSCSEIDNAEVDGGRVPSDASEVRSRNYDETNSKRAPRNSPVAQIELQQVPVLTSVVDNKKDIKPCIDRLHLRCPSVETALGGTNGEKVSDIATEELAGTVMTGSYKNSVLDSPCTTLVKGSSLGPHLQRRKAVGEIDLIQSRKSNKLSHLNQNHRCKICNRLYELKSSLNRHMRVHRDIDKYKCKLCNKQFSETRTLRGHLLIHTGEKPYECSFCGYKFRNKSTLNKHEKRHGTVRPYRCEFCEKKFFQGTDLRKHLKTHEVDKEFKCDQCDKQFYLKAQFRRHYRVHTGEKPFECNKCKRAFADKLTLKRHTLTHTGHRPDPNYKKTDEATSTTGSICNRKGSPSGVVGLGGVQKTHSHPVNSINNGMGDIKVDKSRREHSEDVEERSRTIVKITKTAKIARKKRLRKSVVPKRIKTQCSDEAPVAKDIIDIKTENRELQDSGIHLDNTGSDTENYSDYDVDQLKVNVQIYSDKDKAGSSTRANCRKEKEKNVGQVILRRRQRKHIAKPHGIDLPDPILIESTNREPSTLMLPCKLCKKNCMNKASYIAHYKACLASPKSQNPDTSNTKYECTICEKVYELKASLRRHMRVHQELDEYKCDVCSKQFSDTKSLRGHLLIHTGEKPYSCSFCGFRFRDKSTLRTHETRHGTERPFCCEVCDKRFFLGTDLRKHLKVHETDREFKCDQCAKQFYLLAEFKRHYRKHTGERPFECQHCGKCFADQSSLKSHIVIHTGDKPFQCDICGATFSWQCRLDKHLRRHNDDRPYTCNTCHKRFIQNSDLKTHERRHAAEENHECLSCGERFADSDSLSKHKRTHSPVKNHLCSFCGKAFVTSAVLKRHWTTCNKNSIIETSDDCRGYVDSFKTATNNGSSSLLTERAHDRTSALDNTRKFRIAGGSLDSNSYKDVNKDTEILIDKSPEVPLNTFLNQSYASVPKN